MGAGRRGSKESGVGERGRQAFPDCVSRSGPGRGRREGQHDRDQGFSQPPGSQEESGAQPEAMGAVPTGELEGAAPACKTGFLCSECHTED